MRRFRRHLARRIERVRASWVPILQCATAAGAAWFVANDLIGHTRPFFAPIAAVISLGISLGSRLRRAAELVVGVSLGVLVGDLIISVIGSGAWQITLVVALAMAAAVFADGAALLVAQAGASAVLVATLLPPGESGGFDRCVDALVGGSLGLLVAALLPTDPVAPVRRESRMLLDELAGVLGDVATALRTGDAELAAAALRRGRATQPLVDDLRAALRAGAEVTRVSPLVRRRRGALTAYGELAERADYAMRNTRVLARRALTALQDGEPTAPEFADVVGELAGAVGVLTAQLSREGDRSSARDAVLDVARRARELDWEPGASGTVMLAQVRSIAVDLLQATGLSRAEALSLLRG
ncbi:Uncharacterized membrane protein YgaE, UPF0421/DUF939 family [Pseudonocardia thermophila]|uniref:Uncharacterized membrane protein YgaE, UPF0421/DUF939 family n=1 Tax=Pseudonocardia thermophila TaxID=1848 RepID=A0A1M6VJV6_PSETH|nr:FUSC family protein [Pseudonocardia thermophila]SHK81837.1 Uncharacterized membrane protein YgaE, UPF0421/DUF939 family [Pseudonocardia thermophila]